jgi:hypothetical protein
MPYPQRRCIVEIEFRGGRCKGGSVHLFWAASSSILVALVLGGHKGERSSWWCSGRRGGGAGAAGLHWRRGGAGGEGMHGRLQGCWPGVAWLQVAAAGGLQTCRGAGGRATGAHVAQAAGARGGGAAGAARQGEGLGIGGNGAGAQVPGGEEWEGPWVTACREQCRGSQVGFIWAQGLGHMGKAACRTADWMRAQLADFYRAKCPGST